MNDQVRARTAEGQRRLESFEARMALPIFVSAVFPIVLTMAGSESIVAAVVMVVTWFVFVADLLVHRRLLPGYLRSGRGRFDVAVVLLTAPWFLVPGLGAGRFVALARLARLVRIAKAGGGAFRRLAAQLGRVGIVTVALVLTCAYVAYGAERSVNDAYSSYGEAVWWATVTITTVGYGDIFPVTTSGRIAGVVLMFSGLGVLGVLAGALASFFGFGTDEAVSDDEPGTHEVGRAPVDEPDDPARVEVEALRARLDELDRAITAVRDRLR